MELPLKEFEDYPIEFKQINPEDFAGYIIKEDRKYIIAPNDEGFIGDALTEAVDKYEKNTVLINCAVGQGKTTAILNLIDSYYKKGNCFVVIASPFVSLVGQYYNDLLNRGYNENELFKYDFIDFMVQSEADVEEGLKYEPTKMPIHIITINSLLGNPGDGIRNSGAKRDYINRMKYHCESTGKKVIFVYDEIHDSIYNFKEEFIFYLWKWKNITFKNYILSATFSESSKIVIEYLAELTDDKIQIIESERRRIPKKQSSLYLHYNNSKSYQYNNTHITSIVSKLVDLDKEIDILCYSKTLAKDIGKESTGIGFQLRRKYEKLNICVSDPINSKDSNIEDNKNNRYSDSQCNIGTNFKSGVNIEKENHALVIIMPPYNANSKGIFTDGTFTVIQAIARQRKKGEIHIILPNPKPIAMLPFEGILKAKFEEVYNPLANQNLKTASYYPLNKQQEHIGKFYDNQIRKFLEDEINAVEKLERGNKPRLEFPSYKLYKLNMGDVFLATQFDIWGKDLSTFITYSAITNQFFNCKLVQVNSKPKIIFKKDAIQKELKSFFDNYIDEDFYNSVVEKMTDYAFYHYLRNELFSHYNLEYREEGKNPFVIKPFNCYEFERQFLYFFHLRSIRNEGFIAKNYDLDGDIIDIPFSRGDYMLSCLAHLNSPCKDSENSIVLKEAYLLILEFYQRILVAYSTIRDINYFEVNPPSNFYIDGDIEKVKSIIRTLKENDNYFKNKIFSYFSNDEEAKTDGELLSTFYNYLITDFTKFDSIKRPSFNGERKNDWVRKIKQFYPIPAPNSVLNFFDISYYKFESNSDYNMGFVQDLYQFNYSKWKDEDPIE